MNIKKIDLFILSINILFFIYYSFQLLVFTDEFALRNIGSFSHAIAGLSEILGIIFLSLVPKNKKSIIIPALITINKLELVNDRSIPAILISGPIL